MNLRFICAQPATTYYLWQVEVMIKNFYNVGINPNNVDIVCSIDKSGILPVGWVNLAQKYNTFRFFFYPDTRENPVYVSSIRPNILKQHFKSNPYLADEAIFYHDCDIVFTRPIDWNKFLFDDKWYGSDCRFYIAHDYINSKGGEELDLMCQIVGIDKQVIKDNELNAIGAQYLMKGIDWTFWAKVEQDSEDLFKEVSDLVRKKIDKDPTHHGLQIWTADMWAVLWNGWLMGKETICHSDFNFAWGVSHITDWTRCNIYHNAGVTDTSNRHFYKGIYQDRIPPKDLDINHETCSFMYYQLVRQL